MTTTDLLREAAELAADEDGGRLWCDDCAQFVRVGPVTSDLLHTSWECYGGGWRTGHAIRCGFGCGALFTFDHCCEAMR